MSWRKSVQDEMGTLHHRIDKVGAEAYNRRKEIEEATGNIDQDLLIRVDRLRADFNYTTKKIIGRLDGLEARPVPKACGYCGGIGFEKNMVHVKSLMSYAHKECHLKSRDMCVCDFCDGEGEVSIDGSSHEEK